MGDVEGGLGHGQISNAGWQETDRWVFHLQPGCTSTAPAARVLGLEPQQDPSRAG